MSTDVIVTISPKIERDMLKRIRDELSRGRNFEVFNPIHPQGYTVRDIYSHTVGMIVGEFMDIHHVSNIWLPLAEEYDLMSLMDDYHDVLYGIMPTDTLKRALLQATREGFRVESVGQGVLVFKLLDEFNHPVNNYNWRTVNRVKRHG